MDEKARTFDEWSHIVSLCYAQVTHSIGLNDVCDALQMNSGPLSAIRGATPPTRNNFSHANKVRDAVMAEKLFWAVSEYLGTLSPEFVRGKAAKRFARKFKRTIHVVDSTTIELIATCMDWAKHRRTQSGGQVSPAPGPAEFSAALCRHRHGAGGRRQARREVCAGVKDGEIAIFDKAYMDFGHLWDLTQRGVVSVTRAKENLQYEAVESYSVKAGGKIVADELIGLKNAGSQKAYPDLMRRVVAWVEVDGKERLMTFLSNQLTWSAASIRGPLPLPVADRSLLQANQADLTVGRLLGDQRQCGALAGMDGALSLPAAALSGLPLQLGA